MHPGSAHAIKLRMNKPLFLVITAAAFFLQPFKACPDVLILPDQSHTLTIAQGEMMLFYYHQVRSPSPLPDMIVSNMKYKLRLSVPNNALNASMPRRPDGSKL